MIQLREPMSNQEAKTKLASADSFSRTRMEVTKFKHIWTIENFSFFLTEKSIASPSFSAEADDGIQWCLYLFPKGSDEDSKDYISAFLNLRSCGENGVRASFRICILSAKEESMGEMPIFQPQQFEKGTGRGCRKLIKREALFKNQRSALLDDKLTLFCEVWYAAGDVTSTSQRPEVPPHEQSMILAELFVSKMYPDVVLAVNGKEFRAHKSILAARSPGFKTMFEERLDKFEFSGINEDTLEDLLRFIYTGKARHCSKMATWLLTAIDKHVLAKKAPTEGSSRTRTERTGEISKPSHAASLGEKQASEPCKNRREDQSTRQPAIVEERALLDPLLLDREKFNGDKSAFYSWWRDFKANIHDRHDLSPGQKLTYLRHLVEGEAATFIKELKSTDYRGTMKALFLRFGSVADLPLEKMMQLLTTRLPATLRLVEDKALTDKFKNTNSPEETPRSRALKQAEIEEACSSKGPAAEPWTSDKYIELPSGSSSDSSAEERKSCSADETLCENLPYPKTGSEILIELEETFSDSSLSSFDMIPKQET